MGAWQAPSASAAETQGASAGGPHGWPHSVVRWLFGLGEEHEQPASTPIPVARYHNICISREAGAGGSALARMVSDRLGWKVYDEELIEAIAHRMEVSIDEVRALDEQAPSMVQDWLLPLREEYYAPQEAYLDHLAKLIEAIGRAGESILVGRGGGFMLPRETTLSLRVIAPVKVRAQRLAERMGVSVRTARRAARDLDRRRAQFDRTMHRANPSDPHNFDMVLDTASLSLEIAAEVIVRAVEAGLPGGLASSASQRGRPDPGIARPLAPDAGIPVTGLRGTPPQSAGSFSLTPQTSFPTPGDQVPRDARVPFREDPSL
jgi:cytidylate kinase